MSWASALLLWSALEGGPSIVTHPSEGDTAGGILQKYYLLWAQKHGREPIWPPTLEAHASYLHDEIWTPHHCGDFPDLADSVAFQCVGNIPWTAANEVLQLALGVFPHGV